jgi:N-acetylmuramoyl-L-alanine amidase
MRRNKLNRDDKLTMGQKLVIPYAMPACSIIALYPSRKWKYIIIHHSATDEGSALSFYHSHKRRGFIYGLGYHFVIDNGTRGKPEGYIEVSPRWIKQQDGAHCQASSMNHKSIGVCLVGNFSKEWVSDKQLLSLVYLVNILRRYYHIPLKNIIGHGQVPGAQTECPGKRFPWKRFFTELKKAGN